MNTTVASWMATEMASLERVVDPPTGNLGYGSDLWCILDLLPNVAEVDPNSYTAIGQAVLRRLVTARGTLPDDPHYGIDVRGMLNRGIPVQQLRDLQGQIRSEVMKDDRIADALVSVTMPEQRALTVVVTITPEVPNLVPFDLTLAITPETVELVL